MRNLVLGIFFFLFSSHGVAAKPWSPRISLGTHGIQFLPAKLHLSPFETKVEILESEACEAKVQSSSSVMLSENCEFLRGVYQYSFKRPGSETVLSVFSEFLVRRGGVKSYVFLVNTPTVFPKKLATAF